MEEYEVEKGKRLIYRTYEDTEVAVLATRIKCPYCGVEWMENDMSQPGITYTITCDDEFEGGCGKEFQMYFDVD